MGAKIIEKHFILDREIGGPDASFSLDFDEFKLMVQRVREAESSLGNKTYKITSKQKKGKAFGRSLYIVEDVKKGDTATDKNVRSIRPGFGLHPEYFDQIIGKRFNRNIKKGTRLSLDHIEI